MEGNIAQGEQNMLENMAKNIQVKLGAREIRRNGGKRMSAKRNKKKCIIKNIET